MNPILVNILASIYDFVVKIPSLLCALSRSQLFIEKRIIENESSYRKTMLRLAVLNAIALTYQVFFK